MRQKKARANIITEFEQIILYDLVGISPENILALTVYSYVMHGGSEKN